MYDASQNIDCFRLGQEWLQRDTPQPDYNHVTSVELTEIIPSFLKYENDLWLETVNSSIFPPANQSEQEASASNSQKAESEKEEQAETWRTLGESLVKHSQFLHEIHAYFVKLDYRRCCVANETILGKENTQQNFVAGRLKIVKKHASPEKTKEKKRKFSLGGLKSRLKINVPSLHLLNEKDKKVYKYAIQCAYFPMLCSPNTPQPSPSLDLPESTSAGNSSAHVLFSPTDGQGVETESQLLLLRDAFDLDLSVHEMYEKEVLQRGNSTYNAAMELLKELHNRRALLEENKHPIYTPNAFLFPDGYEKWRTKEVAAVKQLMRGLYSLPASSLPPSNKLSDVDSIECYTVLEAMLTKHEMNQRLENADTGDYIVSERPLSTASKKLLKEFALRYGVGEVYRRVSSLRCLASNFTPTTWSIKCVTQAVQSMVKLLQTQYQVFLKVERDMLIETLNDLRRQAEDVLQRIGLLCPRFIKFEGIDALVNLLNAIFTVQIALGLWSDDGSPPLRDILSKCIEEAAGKAYESIRNLVLIDYEPVYNKTELSPKVLRRILHDMREKLRDFGTLQNNCHNLKSYLNVSGVVAREFYVRFIQDVKEVIVSRTETAQTASVDYELLGLAYKLAELDEEWKNHITVSEQRWRLYYILEARIIIKAITERAMQMVKRFVSADRETALIATAGTKVTKLSHRSPSKNISPSSGEQSLNPSNSFIHSQGSAFHSVSTLNRVEGTSSRLRCSISPISGPLRPVQDQNCPRSVPKPNDSHVKATGASGTAADVKLRRDTEKSSTQDDTTAEEGDDVEKSSSQNASSPLSSSPTVSREETFSLDMDARPSTVDPSIDDNEIIAQFLSSLSDRQYTSNVRRSFSDSNLSSRAANSLSSSVPCAYNVKTNEDCIKCISCPAGQFPSSDEFLDVFQAQINQAADVLDPPLLRYPEHEINDGIETPLHDASKGSNESLDDSASTMTSTFPNEDCCDKRVVVTSSLVDTLIVIVHLLRFCGEICKLLAPRRRYSGDKDAMEISIAIRKDVCRELTRSIASILQAYSDNVCLLDLCGMPPSFFKKNLSHQVSRHMVEMMKRGLLCGCRHRKDKAPQIDTFNSEFVLNFCPWMKKKKAYSIAG